MECLVDLVTLLLFAQWGCLPYTIVVYLFKYDPVGQSLQHPTINLPSAIATKRPP